MIRQAKAFLAFTAAVALGLAAGAGLKPEGVSGTAEKVVRLWPEGGMPLPDPSLTYAPFLEWHVPTNRTSDAILICVSGGGYVKCSVTGSEVAPLRDYFLARGVTVVTMRYRVPAPKGMKPYVAAWQDAQRTVRLVRHEAKTRGLDPENIGFCGGSAGGHLCLLAAASSQTPAYEPVDEIDRIPCHVNWAVPIYAAYTLKRAPKEVPVFARELAPEIRYDEKTPPMCIFVGDGDGTKPLESLRVYHKLRSMKLPTEVHIFAEEPHVFMADCPMPEWPAAKWMDRLWEWAFKMEIIVPARKIPWPEYPKPCAKSSGQLPIWPAGKMPDRQAVHAVEPFMEWHVPTNRTSDAIVISTSGGGYDSCSVKCSEVAPVVRYFTARGVTVVTLLYRTPRPAGIPFYRPAWQDAQRTVRLVRHAARAHGLDPEKIGFVSGSAGGHLAVLVAGSSETAAYAPIDEIDREPCHVNWAVSMYPAYCIALDPRYSRNGKGEPPIALRRAPDEKDILNRVLAPEFRFDAKTAPMCFLHGDSDHHPSTASMMLYAKLKEMDVPAELHIFAKEPHCFMSSGVKPGMPAFGWLDRIGDWLYRMHPLAGHPMTWNWPKAFRSGDPHADADFDAANRDWVYCDSADELICKKKGTECWLREVRGDYVFHCEVLIMNGTDLRIYPRADNRAKAASGPQVRILDDARPDFARLPANEGSGSVMGVAGPAHKQAVRTPRWQNLTIWVKGSRVKVALGDEVTADCEVRNLPKRGQLGFRREGGNWIRMRDLRIQPLERKDQ